MEFTVRCQCGTKLKVKSSDAGATKECRCGKANEIPSLSELRRQSGQASFDISIADRLRAMHAQGILPQKDICAQCGLYTSDTMHFTVECERSYRQGRGFLATTVLMFISPLFLWRELLGDYNVGEVHGREVLVHTPLRICADCAVSLNRNKKRIRRLLQGDPLYEQLLQDYPRAEVHFPEV